MARECPNGTCVIGKTEQFLVVLRDPKADWGARAEALKYVVHFIGDLHQPLHEEDNGDKGRNERHVIFEGHPDNLHWLWDSGLLAHVNRNPEALARDLREPDHAARWGRVDQGTIQDWVMEGHAQAQTVVYGGLGSQNPVSISASYERRADPVIELQSEKAGVRLAYLLNAALKVKARQQSKPQMVSF